MTRRKRKLSAPFLSRSIRGNEATSRARHFSSSEWSARASSGGGAPHSTSRPAFSPGVSDEVEDPLVELRVEPDEELLRPGPQGEKAVGVEILCEVERALGERSEEIGSDP